MALLVGCSPGFYYCGAQEARRTPAKHRRWRIWRGGCQCKFSSQGSGNSPRLLEWRIVVWANRFPVRRNMRYGSRRTIRSRLPPFESHMRADIKTQYAARLAAAEIERDPAQERVLDMLAQLERRLRERRLARKSSSLGWLFGARERCEEPIRGLYIFGEVGRGKTMLMDLFFGASAVVRKRRAHFHEFMSDVHE